MVSSPSTWYRRRTGRYWPARWKTASAAPRRSRISVSWFEKLKVLLYEGRRYYMLQDPVGSNGATLFYVRVVIYPALIRPPLKDTQYQQAEVAIFSVGGAVL